MTHLIRRIHRLTVASIGLFFAAQTVICSRAEAQVVLDMPPPPEKRMTAPFLIAEPSTAAEAPPVTLITGGSTYEAAMAMTLTPATHALPPQQEVTVGDVALYRYSLARTGTYDTYFDEGLYGAGIRTYSYPRFFPQFVWGPWFFPFFHSHHCW